MSEKPKLFRWKLGRQGSGYEILPIIFSKTLNCDCYLIKIPQGISVPQHNDKVEHKKHFRFNIHFGFYEGGVFKSEDYLIKLFNFVFLFRPDINLHSMTEVTRGNVYIFSFGWITNE